VADRPKGDRPATKTTDRGQARPKGAKGPQGGGRSIRDQMQKGKPQAKGAAVAKQPVKGGAAKRKAAEQQRRRRTILYTVLTLGVIGALVAFIVINNRQDAAPSNADFDKEQAALAGARSEAGCTDIQTFPNAGQTHIAEDKQPSNWNSNPPTSGDHDPSPLPGGFYPQDQGEKHVVHSLEHGYVVIQYKNAGPDIVAQLQNLQKGYQGQKFVVMRYDALPKDGIALSAWTHNQVCSRYNADVVKSFIDAYMLPKGKLSSAPEPLAA
jgi:hypothetical protein